MKRNEIIELNGVEYTLELNRDSFIQIDKICNVKKWKSIASHIGVKHIKKWIFIQILHNFIQKILYPHEKKTTYRFLRS